MRAAGVVITGASSGIGAAAARMLAEHGFIAFAGVRREADAAQLRALHENVRPIQLDVTVRESIASARELIAASGIPLHGVVSNAGIALGGALEHLPIDELRRLFEVNVFGALAVVQAFLPGLCERTGRIVFVGSISGRLAMPFIGPYSASKFALRALADALRVELAPSGIAVSLIEPGSVKTPIWKKGRDSKDRLNAMLGSGARPYYYRAVEQLMRQTEAEERAGMPPERVARAILHALRARRPRAQQVIGTPARLGSAIALLPPGLRDRVLRAAMRL